MLNFGRVFEKGEMFLADPALNGMLPTFGMSSLYTKLIRSARLAAVPHFQARQYGRSSPQHETAGDQANLRLRVFDWTSHWNASKIFQHLGQGSRVVEPQVASIDVVTERSTFWSLGKSLHWVELLAAVHWPVYLGELGTSNQLAFPTGLVSRWTVARATTSQLPSARACPTFLAPRVCKVRETPRARISSI